MASRNTDSPPADSPDPFSDDRTAYAQLSREISAPCGWRTPLAPVGVTLLVALVANAFAVWYLRAFPVKDDYWRVQEKWRLLRREPVDCLVLGDSSGNQGIVPSILEERLGGKAVNVCTLGDMTTLSDALMLKVYIATFGPPKQVILVHVYDIWDREMKRRHLSVTGLPIDYWEGLSPPFTTSLARDTEIGMMRYLPLYTKHESLAAILGHPERWFHIRFQMDDDGYMPEDEAQPKRVHREMRKHIEQTADKRFHPAKTATIALENIAALSAEHGFPVYIVNSPLYRGLWDNPSFRTYYGDVQAWLDSFVDQHDQMLHLFNPPLLFEANEMESADHLLDSSARVYTAAVAEAIAKNMAKNPSPQSTDVKTLETESASEQYLPSDTP